MGTPESSPKTVRLLTALLLVGTFATGTVTGAGLVRWFEPQRREMLPPPLGLPMPFRELGLSGEQNKQVEQILARYRPELDKVLDETFPKMRRIRDQMERDIAVVLTPAQKKQLKQMQAQRPPRGAGPGPMGRPGGPMGPLHPPPGGWEPPVFPSQPEPSGKVP